MPMGRGRNMIMPINNSMYVCLCAFVCAYMWLSVCDMMSRWIGQGPNFVLNLPGDYNIHWHQLSVPLSIQCRVFRCTLLICSLQRFVHFAPPPSCTHPEAG